MRTYMMFTKCLLCFSVLAISLLGQSVEPLDARECTRIIVLSHAAKTDRKALQQLLSRAVEGDAGAENGVGDMYANGEWGPGRDYKEALKWYRQAAEQGYADAQCNLGIMYANGTEVHKDTVEALKWFRKAAEQGNSAAQKALPELNRLAAQEKAKADLLAAERRDRLAAQEKAKADLLAAERREAERREKAKAAELQAYSQRPKTTLEQVLNYTTTADVNGDPGRYWISGANGQNKCVLEARGDGTRKIDIRRLSQVGFRISQYGVGDEQSTLPRAQAAVLERLQKAWGLAFSECPSVEKAPF